MRKLIFSSALGMALAVSGAAFAQTTGQPGPGGGPPTTQPAPSGARGTTAEERSGTATQRGSVFTPSGEVLLSNLIGMDVKNAEGDNIGEIDEILMGKDGKVSHAILSVGGFLGVGERHVQVPFSEIQIQPDGRQVTYNTTKDALKQQPEYKIR
ncbi:MAG TPA: PRC-barrel domain-containing protein [Alphaproteobacteria bacterium]